MLESFEPYGEANPKPTFMFKDAEVVEIKLMGKDKSHSKITLKPDQKNDKHLELVLFRQVLEMPQSGVLSCSYTLNKNIWNNNISIQFLVNKLYLK